MPAPLVAAVAAFTATSSLVDNAARIRAFLAEAGRAHAALLLTPECALIGYPGAARPSLAGIDWCAVADQEERLEAEAARAGVVLVLGTASPLSSGVGNDALVLGATSRPVRYRKRCLTPLDREHFAPSPEQGACLVTIAGWRMGITICYELRFGALWAGQAADGADGFLTIAHMAGRDVDPGTKAAVVPQLYSARAAEWATPLLLANTAAADRWLDSGLWDARGIAMQHGAEGLMLARMLPRTAYDPWYGALRAQSLAQVRPPGPG